MTGLNPESAVIDEIDALVNESISRGPTDDYGRDYLARADDAGEVHPDYCELGCGQDFHGLLLHGCPGAFATEAQARRYRNWGDRFPTAAEFMERHEPPRDGAPWMVSQSVEAALGAAWSTNPGAVRIDAVHVEHGGTPWRLPVMRFWIRAGDGAFVMLSGQPELLRYTRRIQGTTFELKFEAADYQVTADRPIVDVAAGIIAVEERIPNDVADDTWAPVTFVTADNFQMEERIECTVAWDGERVQEWRHYELVITVDSVVAGSGLYRALCGGG